MNNASDELDHLRSRVAALEAESAIRRLVARYMAICDDLTPETDLTELASLFASGAVWEGAGDKYRDTFGEHQGRDAIVAFLSSYCSPQAHFASNVHFLTSESLQVDGDGARGTWVMLQTPTFSNTESFVLAARLNLGFTFEQGAWRIVRFATTNLFGRPIAGGWHSSAPIPTPGSTHE
ncbi:MAG: nuclear transport factor 2 family protein [Pseudomonadota bacterium]